MLQLSSAVLSSEIACYLFHPFSSCTFVHGLYEYSVAAAPINAKWLEKAQQWCPSLLAHYQATYPAVQPAMAALISTNQQRPADGKTVSTNQQQGPAAGGKRILVYGLQSSGAALVAYALAQVRRMKSREARE